MRSVGKQPTLGSPQRVIDVVVEFIEQSRYREARLQLIALDRRLGLDEANQIVGEITAPPMDLDPKTRPQVTLAVPKGLPAWLVAEVSSEVGRIYDRRDIAGYGDVGLIARILAASLINAVLSADAGSGLLASLDLRESATSQAMDEQPVVDLSTRRAEAPRVVGGEPLAPAPDWLGRQF